ncbi:flagellar assembly protein FliW [Maledivibacter halophilus]|uniref:Flagellar assembly factor FliW n=1 Tax=Maledivibacter halophilus TaxID=36842 RepID=A0A1T5JWY1_9FIRM|nr:flagellar assembly protein FliW [Maledivibacter halophilus]SKC55893.1 flagellar assembly factor FliW [Maledivibacter halophilus]
MKLNTRHFGEIQIDESKIIHFNEGLLGFEKIKKYAVINNPDPEVPFCWLQSVDKPDLAFVIANPFLFINNYEFDIPDKIVKELELKDHKELIIYSIAVVPESIEEMTLNLRGPIIINWENKRAKQIVLESNKYPLKYKIFDTSKKTK